ncbi:nitrous oxide reductase family maturation protein NosD [Leptobacterium flavescens]|uniref:Nitrous oxide reductase family maturation protein NosD n=1 Tax=Leptobacterium flavescens TaxID=472055 RepID=A0A6P0UNF7_9FLAO|nr:nitrous oxide reductase family maturation protein NosD [Leptobacterium flavescens]NER14705.1 nitrous oxide reductase family maturation protein NosD [Leptobacterium flavescens]
MKIVLKYYTFLFWLMISAISFAQEVEVCNSCTFSSLAEAISEVDKGARIYLKKGIYKEYDVLIDKPVQILAEKGAVLDAQGKGYGLIISADSVRISGITIRNIGKSYTKDFAAIYISRSKHFTVENAVLEKVFFGILVEKSHHGQISNNHISSEGIEEAGSGNGVHMWHSSNVVVEKNELHNLRDGIYFEFVKNSKVINNKSHDNIRYGLHFMFSNQNEYHYNTFTHNGAGVAVMFSKFITMTHNSFKENWGAASYGLLLKEIYDARIEYNRIEQNTVGINAEGSTRISYKNNNFISNGWAVKISGACYTNIFERNNFLYNSFDVSYNSNLNDNSFNNNYWSAYTGYDLDKNGIGDVPHRPVKLFSYVVNRTPETIVLLRSLFVDIINFSEKVSPVFTPDNLMDDSPLMKKIK